MVDRKINYNIFVVTGITFMGLGVIFMFAINTVLGLSFLAIGLGNLAIGLSGKHKEK